MPPLITLLFIFISITLLSCNEQSNTAYPVLVVTEIKGKTSTLTPKEILDIDSVDIDFQFLGNCYAYSSPKNAMPSNGEAHSDNLPQQTDSSFPRQGLYLTINQHELIKIDSNLLGCKLYLVNTTDTLVTLNASDSRLYIIAEALNAKNEWVPISYLPSSDCGNSYHTIRLDKAEYWSFNIPVFKGPIQTKLRYALQINEDHKIVSNEIEAHLNSGQFDKEKRQGYQNNNIMDPYQD